MGDIFDEMFGNTSKKRRKNFQFDIGDIGLGDIGDLGLGDPTPNREQVFRINGKNFIRSKRNPNKLVRLTKRNQNRISNEQDLFGFGGDLFGPSKKSGGGGLFDIGSVGDTKKNVSILGNKKQQRETQQSIDIITNDAQRAGTAIKKGVASIRSRLRRDPRITQSSVVGSSVEGTPQETPNGISIDESGSTADGQSKEFCFQARKGNTTTVRCFRNRQIALRMRENFVSRGFSVSAIDEKVRR